MAGSSAFTALEKVFMDTGWKQACKDTRRFDGANHHGLHALLSIFFIYQKYGQGHQENCNYYSGIDPRVVGPAWLSCISSDGFKIKLGYLFKSTQLTTSQLRLLVERTDNSELSNTIV